MKVYPFKIPKRPNENIVLQIDKGPHFFGRLHQHDEIQLSYIVSGRGKLVIGNGITSYEAGDFVAIGSNLPHLFQNHQNSKLSHMVSLFFLRESFGKDFFENQEMASVKPIFESLSRGFRLNEPKDFIKDLFLESHSEKKFDLFINLLKLLHYLVKTEKQLLSTSNPRAILSSEQGQRLQLVFDYVMKNFHQEISLQDVAETIHMSRNAFCRFFKQRTNKTFFQFLTEIRIHHACELLRENWDLSISEIALRSGFHTISNFNRQFSNITKTSPRKYRTKTHI